MSPDDTRLDPDDRTAFDKAMRDVAPLPDRDRSRAAGRPAKKRISQAPSAKRAGLAIHRSGDRVEGLARGVSRRVIDRLRRGDPPVDERLDLHGMTEREARQEVLDALSGMWLRRARCLLVVHGRGLRSEAGPVLKEALPSWLAESPWRSRIRALTTADPARGGSGATLVFLRRRRLQSGK